MREAARQLKQRCVVIFTFKLWHKKHYKKGGRKKLNQKYLKRLPAFLRNAAVLFVL